MPPKSRHSVTASEARGVNMLLRLISNLMESILSHTFPIGVRLPVLPQELSRPPYGASGQATISVLMSTLLNLLQTYFDYTLPPWWLGASGRMDPRRGGGGLGGGIGAGDQSGGDDPRGGGGGKGGPGDPGGGRPKAKAKGKPRAKARGRRDQGQGGGDGDLVPAAVMPIQDGSPVAPGGNGLWMGPDPDDQSVLPAIMCLLLEELCFFLKIICNQVSLCDV